MVRCPHCKKMFDGFVAHRLKRKGRWIVVCTNCKEVIGDT